MFHAKCEHAVCKEFQMALVCVYCSNYLLAISNKYLIASRPDEKPNCDIGAKKEARQNRCTGHAMEWRKGGEEKGSKP